MNTFQDAQIEGIKATSSHMILAIKDSNMEPRKKALSIVRVVVKRIVATNKIRGRKL